MALTLEGAFEEFIGKITPTPLAIQEAETRTNYAVRLLQSGFRTGEVYKGGSMFRGTALSGISDADVIVKIDIGSTTPTAQGVMTAAQEHLSPLHRGTQAREDGQAITLHYNTGPKVDIVPAKLTVSIPILLHQAEFYIPDTNTNQWMPSYAKQHDQAMRGLSEEARQLIRMIKYWNQKHSKYLKSFHIETLVLNEAVGMARRSYSSPPPVYIPNASYGWSWAILHFFHNTLEHYGVDALRPNPQIPTVLSMFSTRRTIHPIPQIGRVDDYMDGSEVLPRLLTAFKQARDGWGAERDGKHALAIAEFGKIFGEKFPVYG